MKLNNEDNVIEAYLNAWGNVSVHHTVTLQHLGIPSYC